MIFYLTARRLTSAAAALVVVLVACFTPFTLTEAQAQTTGTTTFGSTEAPANDAPISELTDCSRRLEECEQDGLGVPFLGAAYAALWVILMIYLAFNHARSARLRTEIDELRARLLKAEHTGTPS